MSQLPSRYTVPLSILPSRSTFVRRRVGAAVFVEANARRLGRAGINEATQAIRSREARRSWAADGDWHPVAIVAMTAHAMQGDRAKCLDAGMDDYVAKPIKPAELFAAMERV